MHCVVIEGDDEFRNSRYACIVLLFRATTSLHGAHVVHPDSRSSRC
jgi:hypothetical protein